MKSLLAAVLLAAACALPCAAQPSQRVNVQGEVKAPLTLTAQDLRAFPADQQGRFTQSRGSGAQEQRSTVQGVKLAAVIERAGLRADGRNDWKTTLVVVTATDGYRAVFTWPELSNTPVGEGVLLLYERDGAALDGREGAIALMSTTDKRLGARHVRNVSRVDVRGLD